MRVLEMIKADFRVTRTPKTRSGTLKGQNLKSRDLKHCKWCYNDLAYSKCNSTTWKRYKGFESNCWALTLSSRDYKWSIWRQNVPLKAHFPLNKDPETRYILETLVESICIMIFWDYWFIRNILWAIAYRCVSRLKNKQKTIWDKSIN